MAFRINSLDSIKGAENRSKVFWKSITEKFNDFPAAMSQDQSRVLKWKERSTKQLICFFHYRIYRI